MPFAIAEPKLGLRHEFGWLRPVNLGDWKPIGGEVSEMRIDFGPGYRLYFARRGSIVLVMLAGGDKSSQARDIRRAQKLLKELDL